MTARHDLLPVVVKLLGVKASKELRIAAEQWASAPPEARARMDEALRAIHACKLGAHGARIARARHTLGVPLDRIYPGLTRREASKALEGDYETGLAYLIETHIRARLACSARCAEVVDSGPLRAPSRDPGRTGPGRSRNEALRGWLRSLRGTGRSLDRVARRVRSSLDGRVRARRYGEAAQRPRKFGAACALSACTTGYSASDSAVKRRYKMATMSKNWVVVCDGEVWYFTTREKARAYAGFVRNHPCTVDRRRGRYSNVDGQVRVLSREAYEYELREAAYERDLMHGGGDDNWD